MMRSTLFLTALLLAALPAFAQTECVDGMAGDFACEGVDMMAHLPHSELTSEEDVSGNDIWGWTDPETGREYALMGLSNGTVFVDVSDPAAPTVIGELPTATENSNWRDIKVYSDHAFIVSEAPGHGMQVFDLSRLRDVRIDAMPITFNADAQFTGTEEEPLGNVHNIVMNESIGHAYAVGSSSCAGGLYTIDVTDPMSPAYLGCYADPQNAYIHDAQCLTYEGPDTDYQGEQLCFNSNEQFLTVVNMTDPTNPELISRAFYPNPSYSHQNWLTTDGRFMIANDELDNDEEGTRTLVFDMQDLDNPQFHYPFFGPTQSIDHNLYVRGNHAFLSHYTTGLRIYNTSDIAQENGLREVGFFDTYPANDNHEFSGSWSNYPYFESGIIIVSDINNGLFILRPSTDFLSEAAPLQNGIDPLNAAAPSP